MDNPNKTTTSDDHWVEVLEPYLKKIFEDEEKEKSIDFRDKIVNYLQTLWKIRYKFLTTNLVLLVIASIFIFVFAKPYYDAEIIILPEYGSKSSGSLSGLAALAGVSLSDGASSVDVYKSLLYSETVINPVVNAKYYSTKFSDSVNLYTYLKIDDDLKISPSFRERKKFLDVYKQIKDIVSVKIESKSKVLTLSIRTGEPQISSMMINNLVLSLDVYVRTKRKSNSALQRMYIEKRVSQVNDTLAIAENALKVFLYRNKVTNQSPQMTLDQARLNRQIQIYQAVVIELTRQLEIARIDEIRDAPVINVQEWAGIPVIKSGPSRLRLLIVSIVLIVLLSIVFFWLSDSLKVFIKKFQLFTKNI